MGAFFGAQHVAHGRILRLTRTLKPAQRLTRAATLHLAYFFFSFGGSSLPTVRYCGVTCSMLGSTSAFTLPKAQERPPSRIDWKIGLVHTSSRWPIEV